MSERPPAWPLSKANLAKLAMKKYRQRWGLYLLEGYSAVTDALAQGGEVLGVLTEESPQEHPAMQPLTDELRKRKLETLAVEPALLKRISGLVTPPPVIAVLKQRPPAEPDPGQPGWIVLALDRVQNPGNAGTLLRSAAFYGVRQVWLGVGTVERYNPKVLRSAMSADLHLEISVDVDLAAAFRQVRESGGRIYAAVMDGEEEVGARPVDGPSVLLLGNEPGGVDPGLVESGDVRLAITRRGPIDSLNVAMAGAILLDRLVRA